MPTMRCHPAQKSLLYPHRGFTLLELMVVVLIMGLIVGLVSVVVEPDERSLLKVEAQRLAQLLELAASEAQITGISLAWTAEADAYQFQQQTEATGWIAVTGNDSLRPRKLPPGIRLSGLVIENSPAPESLRIEFGAYGQTTAFVVELSSGTAHCQVSMSPIGIVQVVMLASPDSTANTNSSASADDS